MILVTTMITKKQTMITQKCFSQEGSIITDSFNMQKPYIIGETAYNHEGDFNYLLKMTDSITDAGLSAVKFHLLLDLNNYLQGNHPLLETLNDWLFTQNEWVEIIDYSHKKGLDIIALCDDMQSVNFIKEKNMPCSIEIHSTSLNDYFMLHSLKGFKGPIYLGVGGSSIDEIGYAISILNNIGLFNVILMYGFQSYPTDYNEINISKMKKLADLFRVPVGYADHTAYNDPYNEIISVLGAASGFNVLEKHFTLDEGVERIDFHAAVGYEKIIKIKQLMEIVTSAYGNHGIRMSQAEIDYGNIGPMKKAIVAKQKINKGKIINHEDLVFKRTVEESTLQQRDLERLIGLKANKDIEEDEVVDFSKVCYKFKTVTKRELTHLEDE